MASSCSTWVTLEELADFLVWDTVIIQSFHLSKVDGIRAAAPCVWARGLRATRTS